MDFTSDAFKAFQRLVSGVQHHGLPVGFLQKLGGTYLMYFREVTSGGNVYNRSINRLSLESSTLNSIPKTDTFVPLQSDSQNVSRAILAVYHEGTHAYFDKFADKTINQLVEEGKTYYVGSGFKTVNNSQVLEKEAEVATQEAAADYVGSRVGAWWSAYERLLLLPTRIQNKRIASQYQLGRELMDIANDYNQSMNQMSVGYVPNRGRDGKEQYYVSRPIFPNLKNYLDQVILEGKIAPTFSQAPRLQRLAIALQKLEFN